MRLLSRRRKLLLAGGVAVTAVVAVYLLRESPVSLTAYRRIPMGVPAAEAAAAFPPARYLVDSTEAVFVVKENEGEIVSRVDPGTKQALGPGTNQYVDKDNGGAVIIRTWIDGNSMIDVYEQDGQIVAKAYSESMPGYELWVRRLLQRMGF